MRDRYLRALATASLNPIHFLHVGETLKKPLELKKSGIEPLKLSFLFFWIRNKLVLLKV
jgi:hypothetical protein